MKNFLCKIIPSAVLVLSFFASCKKEETKITLQGGTAPVLSATVGNNDTIPLNSADSTNTAVAFSWSNPNYTFSDGISSLNVTYNLQFDSLGANFSSPNMQTVSISPDLETSFTVTALNSLVANGLELAFGQSHTIQVRVVALLTPYTSGSPNIAPLYSNAFTFVVTPYAPPPKITPPASGTLFIVGSATAGGWDNPIDQVDPSTQEFTQVSPTEYKITIPLIGGGEYKWIGVDGSWGQQWSVANADTYPNGGPFVSNGNNNIAPAASGTYTIDVNFQTGTFTVTQ